MKITSLLISLIFLFSLGVGVLAQEIELPDPGLTPNSPFYFMEIIAEEIGTFFTFGDLKKAERYAALAAERLAEVQVIAGKGKPELVEKTLVRYKNQLEKSMAWAERSESKGENIEKVMEVLTRVGQATSKHLEVLAEVYEKVPEQAKPAIENAMKVSLKGHEKAVEALKAQNALGEVPETVSLPAQVSQEMRDRVQTRVQQELEIERTFEGIDTSKSLRDLCTEQGGPPEACEKLPSQVFKSFKQIEDYCIEIGGPPEICTTLEAKCKEMGITTPGKCSLLMMTGSVRRVPASEERLEEMRIQEEAQEKLRIQRETEEAEAALRKNAADETFEEIMEEYRRQGGEGIPEKPPEN
jgi:cellobiose-specific phosphotransferase system component IIA